MSAGIRVFRLSNEQLFAGLAGLLLFAIFFRLGTWGVIDSSEARYAEISRIMSTSGDYLHPRYLGIEHYHKPPLTYQITAIAYRIFGVNAFSARVFLQLALILQCYLVFLLANILLESKRKALYASIIYASFIIVWISTRNLTTDAYLNTALLASTLALTTFARSGRIIFIYLGAFLAGIGFLIKITAVFVYMGPIVLTLWWWYRDRLKWTWHYLGALILFLVLGLSWFSILQQEGKEVLRYMLYDQSVVRYTTDNFNRDMPFYFYLLAAPLLSFPWLFVVFQGYYSFTKRDLKTPLVLVLSIWFLLPILFFSFSHSKLILYILPAFPGLAILASHYLSELSLDGIQKWHRVQFIFYGLLFVGIFSYAYVVPEFSSSPEQLVATAIMGSILILVNLQREIDLRIKMLAGSIVFTSMILIASTYFLEINEENSSTAKPVADWLFDNEMEGRDLYTFNKLVPSLAFHTGKPVALIGLSEGRELQFETSHLWRDHYYDITDPQRKEALLQKLLDPSLLLVRRKRAKHIENELINRFDHQIDIGIWRVYY